MRFSSAGSEPWNFRAPQPTGCPRRRAISSRPDGGVRSSAAAGMLQRRIEAGLEALPRARRSTARCTSARRRVAGSSAVDRRSSDASRSRSTSCIDVTSRARRCSSSGSSIDRASASDSRSSSARSAAPASVSRARRTRRSLGSGLDDDEPLGLERAQQPARIARSPCPSRRRSSRTSVPSGPISHSMRDSPSGRPRPRYCSSSAPTRSVTIAVEGAHPLDHRLFSDYSQITADVQRQRDCPDVLTYSAA